MELKRDISGWDIRWDQALADRLVGEGVWPGRTVADFARERMEAHPDKVQIVDGDRNLTCRELYEEAHALACALIGRGLKPGQVVSFQLPNWYEATTVNLAAAMAGLVLNPVVSIYRDTEVKFTLTDSGSKLVFIPHLYRNFDYPQMMRRLRDELGEIPEVVVIRGDAGEFTAYDEMIAKADRSLPLPAVDPDAVKLIMYTSGTTGRAKGVLHTHNTIHAENYKTAKRIGLTEGDSTFNPSPVTHITGAIYALNMPWYKDVKVVLLDTWDPEIAFDLMEKHRCTFSAGATPFLQGLVEVAERRGATLPYLRTYVCGGAAVPPSLIYKAAEVFPNCIPYRAFGMTEAPTLTFGPESREALRYGAETDGEIWMCDIKVVDVQSGEPIPNGEEGEFIVWAPNMAVGYSRLEDNASAYTDDGYFRSGDLGRIVMEGKHVLVTDRKKDLIIRAGENISAREVEEALLKNPAVADIAVVSMPSDKTGEAICAFIVPRAGEDLTFAAMSSFLDRAGLARQKTPERVALMDELPRTASGKVRKDVLRELARGMKPDRTMERLAS